MADDEVVIKLSGEDFDGLILMMGYALGAVHQQEGDSAMARYFLKLANAVNKDNPKWMPYQVPGE